MAGVRRCLPALVAAVGALALFLAPSSARAEAHSVTLLGVSGVGGARFAESLESSLSELYDVVPGDVYKAEARRLGKFGASPDDVHTVCARLRLDAVIAGAVVGAGHRRTLMVAVREGATGQVLARGRYGLGGRTLPLVKERVLRDLVRALDRIHHSAPGTPIPAAPVASDEGEPSGAGDADNGSAPEPAESAPSEAPEEPMVSVERGPTPKPEQAQNGVEAGVGPTLLTRSLGFDVPSAPAYSGGTVYGIRAEGRVFPIALSAELAQAHPVLSSFGFHGWYEHVFTFNSTSAAGTTSTSHASRWGVLFEGRIPLGHHARGGFLTVETGFQEWSWGSASSADLGVPDVNYDLIDGGLAWDKTLGAKWLALDARLAFLGMVGAGAIATLAEYGSASGYGVTASAGLTARPLSWMWLRLSADYDYLGLAFAGAGTRFAHSATEQWAGGQLEVGFAL